MITDNDIKKLEETFVTKNDLDNALEKQTQAIESLLFNFRSDIINRIDQNVGSVAKVEEEQEVTAHRLFDHDNRLEVIEVKLNIAQS